MVECFNLWEFYPLCGGDISIETVNTAVEGTKMIESCAYIGLIRQILHIPQDKNRKTMNFT